MNLKAVSLSLLLLLIGLTAKAQDTFRKEKMNVMGVSYSGYSTTVPFSEHRARQYFSNYLKENGKISERKNFIEIKEVYWKSKEEATKVYALVIGDSTQSRIWIGHSPEAGENLTTAIQGEMENIPLLMRKYHLQHQIKEAEEAASYLSKEIRNAERDGQRLNSKLEQNAQDKIKLEQALEQNAKDKIQLEQDLVTNGKTKEEKAQAFEEVRKQLEYLKEKLSKL